MKRFNDDEESIPLDEKNTCDFTQEDWDKIDKYEFGEDWLKRDEELRGMTLREYNKMRRIEDYGFTNEEMDSGDDD